MDDDLSLSHTRWNCKYHIVFIPKYRRKEIYGKLRSDIGQIIRQLCSYKGVEIIEAHAMPDHIHMLVRIPPKIAVSNFMGYLKGMPTSNINMATGISGRKDSLSRQLVWIPTKFKNTSENKKKKI